MAIEFEGLDNVIKMLDKITDIDRMTRALNKCCLIVQADAVKNVIDNSGDDGSGELAGSIEAKVKQEGNNLIGIVSTNKEYAPYVEYGTGLFAEGGKGRTWDLPWHWQDDKGNWPHSSGQKPEPFLRPALNQNRTRIMRYLQEGITKK